MATTTDIQGVPHPIVSEQPKSESELENLPISFEYLKKILDLGQSFQFCSIINSDLNGPHIFEMRTLKNQTLLTITQSHPDMSPGQGSIPSQLNNEDAIGVSKFMDMSGNLLLVTNENQLHVPSSTTVTSGDQVLGSIESSSLDSCGCCGSFSSFSRNHKEIQLKNNLGNVIVNVRKGEERNEKQFIFVNKLNDEVMGKLQHKKSGQDDQSIVLLTIYQSLMADIPIKGLLLATAFTLYTRYMMETKTKSTSKRKSSLFGRARKTSPETTLVQPVSRWFFWTAVYELFR